MVRKNKKVWVTILLLMEIIMVNLTYQSFLHKEITKEESKVTKKQFAMYIEENDGYVEYKGKNLFPKDYYVNKSLSKCVDEKGNPVENAISSIGTNVTVTSNKTIYCTLYFDKNEILEYLRSKDTNGVLSADIVGDMYRYQGIYEKDEDGNVISDVENYLCLGSDCTEYGEDLYRIIGVTETGELKVIKKVELTENYQIHNIQADIKWPETDLFHKLNDNSDSFYNSLNSKIKSYVLMKNWLYGDTNEYTNNRYNGDYMYAIESGKVETTHGAYKEEWTEETTIWKDRVDAYISLQYIYDYLYAYPGGNPNTNANAKMAWIHWANNSLKTDENIPEWLVTGIGYFTNGYIGYRDLYYDGTIGSAGMKNGYMVRPVFYLSSDILITGEGTLTEPFKIGLKDENNHETFEYPFKGNYETFTVFKDGTYQIELWGAKGGGANGGLGAYTKGNIDLKKNDKLYIYVGENPLYVNGACYSTNPNDSFNGSRTGYCAGGGGATDVRLENGEWDNFDSLKSRLMVAAGGGGALYEYEGYGGYGGALTGGNGSGFNSRYTDKAGYGATQENYKFGVSNVSTCISGNGYYSGEKGSYANAGGGSSYISGYPGCKAITKESTENNITHSESSEHYSGKVFSEPVMIAGNDTMPNYNGESMIGNAGNGYARITKIK